MLNNSVCTDAENLVFNHIIEKIGNLDVEIKVRMRKGTHLEKFAGTPPIHAIF